MANPKLRFRFFEPDIDTNQPLADGTVRIDGFDLERVSGEADAWDQGLGALPGMLAAGAPIVCIPAFPIRRALPGCAVGAAESLPPGSRRGFRAHRGLGPGDRNHPLGGCRAD